MSKDPENQTTATHEEDIQLNQQSKEVHETSSDNDKKMKVLAGSLRFLASVSFICASVYFHYDTFFSDPRDTYDRQGGFFMTGFILLGAALAVEFPTKREKGLWTHVVSMISVLVLFIGSVLLLYDVLEDIEDFDPFAGVFIAGSLLLCACQVMDLAAYLRQDNGTKAMVASMGLAVLGSFFFFLGGVFHIEKVIVAGSHYYPGNTIERYAALLITGSVLYLLHAMSYLIDAQNANRSKFLTKGMREYLHSKYITDLLVNWFKSTDRIHNIYNPF